MAIFVDTLLEAHQNPKWFYRQSCHMYSDDVEELHKFAQSIGLKRSWFQNHPRLPHYDLTANKRKQAVKNGAKEVDIKFTMNFMRRNKYGKT